MPYAALFCWLEAAIWRPRLTCVTLRRFSEGREGSGPPNIPATLRTIWTGVRTNPQGNPHQPQNKEKTKAPACRLVAHERQQIRWLVAQRVMTRRDQTS